MGHGRRTDGFEPGAATRPWWPCAPVNPAPDDSATHPEATALVVTHAGIGYLQLATAAVRSRCGGRGDDTRRRRRHRHADDGPRPGAQALQRTFAHGHCLPAGRWPRAGEILPAGGAVRPRFRLWRNAAEGTVAGEPRGQTDAGAEVILATTTGKRAQPVQWRAGTHGAALGTAARQGTGIAADGAVAHLAAIARRRREGSGDAHLFLLARGKRGGSADALHATGNGAARPARRRGECGAGVGGAGHGRNEPVGHHQLAVEGTRAGIGHGDRPGAGDQVAAADALIQLLLRLQPRCCWWRGRHPHARLAGSEGHVESRHQAVLVRGIRRAVGDEHGDGLARRAAGRDGERGVGRALDGIAGAGLGARPGGGMSVADENNAGADDVAQRDAAVEHARPVVHHRQLVAAPHAAGNLAAVPCLFLRGQARLVLLRDVHALLQATRLTEQQAVDIGRVRRIARNVDGHVHGRGIARTKGDIRVGFALDGGARPILRAGPAGGIAGHLHLRARLVQELRLARPGAWAEVGEGEREGAGLAVGVLHAFLQLLLPGRFRLLLHTGLQATRRDKRAVAEGLRRRTGRDFRDDLHVHGVAGGNAYRIVGLAGNLPTGAIRLHTRPGKRCEAVRAVTVIVSYQRNTGAGLILHHRFALKRCAASVGERKHVTALVVAVVVLLAVGAMLLRHQVGVFREGDGAVAHDAVVTEGHAVAEDFRVCHGHSGGNARAQPEREIGEQAEAEPAGDLAPDLRSRTAGLRAGNAERGLQQGVEGDTRSGNVPDDQRAGQGLRAPVDDADLVVAQPVAGVRVLHAGEPALVGHRQRSGRRRRPARRRSPAGGRRGPAHAVAVNLDVADVADVARITHLAVVIDEGGDIRRRVARQGQARRIALQPVHGIRPEGQHHRVVAQVVAAAPQQATAGERNAAGGVLVRARKADGVLPRAGGRILHPFAGFRVAMIAQYLVGASDVQGGEVQRVQRCASLGQIHPSTAVEENIGNLHAAGHFADFQFHISAQRAGHGVDGDGENLRAGCDGVIEPAFMHGEPPDAAAHVGEAPSVGVLDVKIGAGDVGREAIVRHGLQAGDGAAGHAMVEGAEDVAVQIEAVDEAGIEVRDKELVMHRVEGDLSQPGRAHGQVGQQRDGAGGAIYLPDAAGASARAPLPLHPLRARAALEQRFGHAVTVLIRRNDVQAVNGGGGDVGIGRKHAVDGHAEDEAGLRGRYLQLHRRLGELAVERAGLAQLEDAHGGAFHVDEGLAGALHGAGKAGHHAVIGVQQTTGKGSRLLLRAGGGHKQQQCGQQWQQQ